MKIDFDEKTLNCLDEFEEMFTASGMLFTNMGEEGEILSSDADKIIDELDHLHNSFLDWRKNIICILVNNAINKAKG